MENIKASKPAVNTFSCSNCGADLKYKPGTEHLNCEYCGAENEIPVTDEAIEELDYFEHLDKSWASEDTLTQSYVKCESCGASSTLEPNISAASCPYCSTPLVIEHIKDESIIQPKSILPFKLDKDTAKGKFTAWINDLWFAPNDLKKAVLNFDSFKGIYIPYWTFDTETHTNYIGERGEYYYVSETYTATEDGKSVTKTRKVRKVRWHPTSGSVQKFFDDLLIVATKSIPTKYADELEPWDLENLVPFDKSYLSGFITEKYQVELDDGFDIAKNAADPEIRNLIKRHIGGDEQRIISKNTEYSDISFKHLLLPIFVSSYKFKDKLYQFLVNGRTGEVQGQRPYSWVKITLASIAALVVIGLVIYLYNILES